jgi:hypothetical protein
MMKQESINKNTNKMSTRNSRKKHKIWKKKKKKKKDIFFFYEWELWHNHTESHLKPKILNPIPTLQI